MNGLRLWIAATSIWLFALGNVERLHSPLNIASFVYLLTAGTAIGMVVLPRYRKLPLMYLAVGVLALYFVLKVMLNYPLFGTKLPITVTEICAIFITIWLGRQIVKAIERFEDAAADAAMMQLDLKFDPFEVGQEGIYREIRRARQFERPLTIAAIAPTEQSVRYSLSRFMQEMQSKTIERYVYGRFGEVLARKTNVCDLIARRNNHFILLLPETDRARAGEVIRRLSESLHAELGLDIKAGIAAFPEEEVTFTGLIEHAESEMRAGRPEMLAAV